MTLTARAVETAKPQAKAYKLTDGHGLYLYITSTGGATGPQGDAVITGANVLVCEASIL